MTACAIAAGLHDEIGHGLSLVRMKLGELRGSTTLAEIRRAAKYAIREGSDDRRPGSPEVE